MTPVSLSASTQPLDSVWRSDADHDARKGAAVGAEGEPSGSEKGRTEEKDPVTGEKKDPVEAAKERQMIAQLQARDTQVRAHEAAHLAAAGGIAAGGASFTYQRGPDGKMYAIGGEVPISTSGGKSPEETIQKMRQVAAAALAPADPSPQDYAVAADARAKEMEAMQELRKERAERMKEEAGKAYGEAASSGESEKGENEEPPSLDVTA